MLALLLAAASFGGALASSSKGAAPQAVATPFTTPPRFGAAIAEAPAFEMSGCPDMLARLCAQPWHLVTNLTGAGCAAGDVYALGSDAWFFMYDYIYSDGGHMWAVTDQPGLRVCADDIFYLSTVVYSRTEPRSLRDTPPEEWEAWDYQASEWAPNPLQLRWQPSAPAPPPRHRAGGEAACELPAWVTPALGVTGCVAGVAVAAVGFLLVTRNRAKLQRHNRQEQPPSAAAAAPTPVGGARFGSRLAL